MVKLKKLPSNSKRRYGSIYRPLTCPMVVKEICEATVSKIMELTKCQKFLRRILFHEWLTGL